MYCLAHDFCNIYGEAKIVLIARFFAESRNLMQTILYSVWHSRLDFLQVIFTPNDIFLHLQYLNFRAKVKVLKYC